MTTKKKTESKVVDEINNKTTKKKTESKVVDKINNKTTKKKMIKIEAPGVNVREEDNLCSTILGVAVAGEKFELIEKDLGSGFHKILFDNKTAFIKSEFVKIV